jgi:type IV secretion system protein VirB5
MTHTQTPPNSSPGAPRRGNLSCRPLSSPDRDAQASRPRPTLRVLALSTLLSLAALAPPAHAIIPVTDAGAILHLIVQIHTMYNQLVTAKSQLTQAQSQLTAMTGTRGMQSLLSGTARNYLPGDYGQLLGVMQGTTATYSQLSSQVQSLLTQNAVLTASDLSRLTPAQRALVDGARRETATLDALTRGALANSSQRFTALQQLIQAIGAAHDQKAILDLQARIGAEQAMLQNEASKLDVLYHTAQAQRETRAQRISEQAIADVGSLKALPPMGLVAP